LGYSFYRPVKTTAYKVVYIFEDDVFKCYLVNKAYRKILVGEFEHRCYLDDFLDTHYPGGKVTNIIYADGYGKQ
jgi:hypothetical protein